VNILSGVLLEPRAGGEARTWREDKYGFSGFITTKNKTKKDRGRGKKIEK